MGVMNPRSNVRFDRVEQPTALALISDWPSKSQNLAYSLIRTYGTPHEATPSMLIWRYNGQWKRTVLHREGMQHNMPHPHVDILEQTVDEKIQPALSSEISKFDGSIVIDRTRGEMTAFCESEQANIFLLNLAHDIILGKKTAKEAQKTLLDASDLFHSILPNKYRDALLFTATVDTTDPDRSTAQPN